MRSLNVAVHRLGAEVSIGGTAEGQSDVRIGNSRSSGNVYRQGRR